MIMAMSKVIVILLSIYITNSVVLGQETTIEPMAIAAAAAETLNVPEQTTAASTMVQCENCLLMNNGLPIPQVGLGTSRIGETDADVIRSIKDAIDVGYRHIDTADFYKNEHSIGQALDELIKDGKIRRDDLFITTKVWSNNHNKQLAIQSIKRSIERLKTDYLDLVLVHWPMSFKSGDDLVPKHSNGSIYYSDPQLENWELAYQGLEEAVDLNLTKSIGISNFNINQMERLLSNPNRKYKPVVNQVECHPFLNQHKLLQFCSQNGIYLEAYSPLRRADSELFQNEILNNIAKQHNCTVAQVILRWNLQRNVIVIPRSSKKHRLVENISLFNIQLNDTEIEAINSLNKNGNDGRVIKFEIASNSQEYPFNEV